MAKKKKKKEFIPRENQQVRAKLVGRSKVFTILKKVEETDETRFILKEPGRQLVLDKEGNWHVRYESGGSCQVTIEPV